MTRGRPFTGHVQLTARLSPKDRERVLAYGSGPSDAVRELLAIASSQADHKALHAEVLDLRASLKETSEMLERARRAIRKREAMETVRSHHHGKTEALRLVTELARELGLTVIE